ncbi:MAG: DUF1385 domain-containing protein [Calditrichales bacterium]|nr:MAG: DUF1385 domain-containing protein [Calditrichales bacterium]
MVKKEVEEKIMPVGGQAVIEGVMMRSPKRIATAIRRANGEIEIKTDAYESLVQRKKSLNIPVLRGAVTLIEVMILGIKTLQWSADKAMEDLDEEERKKGKKVKEKKKSGMSTANAIFTVTIALMIGIGMFFVLPLYITTELFNIEKEAMLFNLVSGGIRIMFFMLYVWGISFMKDVKRLFQYHGAEHKSIFAFEDKVYLSAANVQKYSTFHPRCGTSFIVIVMLVSLVFFAFLDTAIISMTGGINLVTRLLTHIPFIPLVGGISYEALKASAKYADSRFVYTLILPGLGLQRITTSQPDDAQVEVAIAALRAALGEEYEGELVEENLIKEKTPTAEDAV